MAMTRHRRWSLMLTWLVCGLVGWSLSARVQRVTLPATTHCASAVGFGPTLTEAIFPCRAEALIPTLERCPPTRAIRRGDLLTLAGDAEGCRMKVSSLPGGIRLSLGLKLNVNSAAATDLQAVPGIGAATASAIVRGRPYMTVTDLMQVKGVGRRRLARWRAHLAVAEQPSFWPPASPSPRTP
ncbi:MAG: ComEA family DNA-binding protein [Bradymonadia bacterium]